MRILFAGTPALAVPSLMKAAHAHEVVAVLTSPDQPSGRGRARVCSPVKEAAAKLNLDVLQPVKLDEAFLDEVKSLTPDILVVAAYGKIFRQSLLALFPQGGINVHPSLLPKYRGPSPITAAILAGDSETGVTIQKVARKFDTGDILAQERFRLKGDETTVTLSEVLAVRGAELLGGVLADLAAGRQPALRPQEEAAATYCRTIQKEHGVARWEESAEVIERKVRAFDPWPRVSTSLDGETLLLLKSHVYPDTLAAEYFRGGRVPGDVLATDRDHGLLVRTGRGVLALERLQLQFKKPLDWRSFLNGHPAIVGTRLGA
ncbi:MAG: methionyl-tRNA formyltransferase [Spirochaetia bacterium]|jgi:methionyl-tRNA formyltransferase